MEVRVLGAHNLESRTTRCTSLLVDGTLALDAGSLASGLTFEEQHGVQAVLLTHRHLDHCRDLPLLGLATRDNGRTVEVFGTPETLEAVTAHLMNGVLYPDFTRQPSPEAPKFRLTPIEPGKPFSAAGYGAVALPVTHGAPAVGFVLQGPDGRRLLYTGDLGAGLPDFGELPPPHLLVTEMNFPNRYEEAARQTGHYTPALLKGELAALAQRWGSLPPVVAVHMVAWLEAEIRTQLQEVARDLGVEVIPAREDMVLRV